MGGKNKQDDSLLQIENEFYNKVNSVISEKITPFYNTFLLISSACFTYFILMNEN